jgi:hypothetical protein
LLTARIPQVQAVGNSVVDGVVILDRLKLPARLFAVDGEGARIECFVSGLAGERAIAAQFGRSPAAPTGLNLVISAVGELSVRKAPSKSQKDDAATSPVPSPSTKPLATNKMSTSAARPGHARGTVTSPSQSALRRIRHSVPPSLEPIAQRLSRNQHLRRLYRKLT